MKKVLIFSTFLAIIVANVISSQTADFSKQNLKNLFKQNIAVAEEDPCWDCDDFLDVSYETCPEDSEVDESIERCLTVCCYEDEWGFYSEDYSCEREWGITCESDIWSQGDCDGQFY